MRPSPFRCDTWSMRRIENMKTLMKPVANDDAAIERQIDEIQRTFGARWEW